MPVHCTQRIRVWLKNHLLNFVNANDVVPRAPNFLLPFLEKLGLPNDLFNGLVDLKKMRKKLPSFNDFVVLSSVLMVQAGKDHAYLTPPDGAEELLLTNPPPTLLTPWASRIQPTGQRPFPTRASET